MAAKYLPKPLEEYPKYHTPCAKDLVEAYDEARDRVGTLDADGQAAYASKCGAGIFAGPCSRFDALYTLGMCARSPRHRCSSRRLSREDKQARTGGGWARANIW